MYAWACGRTQLYEEPLLRHSKEEGEGEAAAAGGARLTRDEVEHIFCHTRPLQGCSAALLQGLIAACRLPSPARSDAIGRCFLAHVPLFPQPHLRPPAPRSLLEGGAGLTTLPPSIVPPPMRALVGHMLLLLLLLLSAI
jgi:hypothetical protein